MASVKQTNSLTRSPMLTIFNELFDHPSSIFIGLSLSLAAVLLYRLFVHPLARIPGPFLARISGHWRDARYWRGTWHDDILEVHRKYGSVVRIAPNEVSIVDQQALKLLYGHGHNAMKTEWYATWDPPIGAPAFFSARDRKLHSFLRKRVSGAFSMTAILGYEPFMQDCIDLLFRQLAKVSATGADVDMSDWVNAFAFDVIGELGYGKPLGHLETGTDVMELRKNILNLFYLSSCVGHYYGQMKIITNAVTQKIFQLMGVPNRIAEFQMMSINLVKARQDSLANAKEGSNTEARPDMLTHFLKMKDANGNPARFEEVLAESLNLLGAGADTTSIAIRACIQAICSRREVYQRLQTEIDEYYTKDQLSGPISYAQTQELPYVVAAVKEAMRLHPSIVFQLLRVTPESGLTVDGKFIPPGTPVGISPMSQNRDTTIWGEDADEFKPERWLESPEKTRHYDSYNMTFGGNGPRMCIGRNIALVEVHKMIVQLFYHFDLEIVNKEKPWNVKSYWFAYQENFLCRVSPRKRHPLPNGEAAAAPSTKV